MKGPGKKSKPIFSPPHELRLQIMTAFRGTASRGSRTTSQALAIDLFGTLKTASDPEKKLILDSFAAELGLPTGGSWDVTLEWRDEENRLHEERKAPTQVDAVARSSRCIIFFECKFTEEAGGCSQTQAVTKDDVEIRPRQCNGNYELQINPRENKAESRCALSGKGILYWDVIPNAFRYDAAVDQAPCPFKDRGFQLMRNTTLAWRIAQDEGIAPAFVILYADSLKFLFPNWLASGGFEKFLASLRQDQIVCRAVSYQALIRSALAAVPAGESNTKWRELSSWIERKIANADGSKL